MRGVDMDTDLGKVSINTIFGYDRYLCSINEKLHGAGVEFYGELSEMTEDDFWHIVGRTTPGNKKKIGEIFRTFPPKFKH